MVYKEIKFETGYRLDLLVEELVIVEIKSIDTLPDVHHKQLLTYLNLADKRLGLLINFNSSSLNSLFSRIVNNFECAHLSALKIGVNLREKAFILTAYYSSRL